jgi:DNA-binding NtrC family response regulator
MADFSILVVEDDAPTLKALTRLLKKEVKDLRTATDGDSGLREIESNSFDLVLLDINLPGRDGIELLGIIRDRAPDTAVVMMTAFATVETAVSALRLGATDYVMKPFEPEQILHVVARIEERKRLLDANREFSNEARRNYDFSNIVTNSRQFLGVLDTLKRVARTKSSILIIGESGTGKELVARAVHTNSDRSHRPMIAVNSSAIPPALMESEFFGHVRGAFTGAVGDHKGFFERADGSTLFLDEIGELPLELQVKLLRAIQDEQVSRVGGSRPIDLDFRLIAATQRDLDKETRAGRFRQDLYYRLNIINIALPPLRDRPEDIPPLVRHFIGRKGWPDIKFSDEAVRALAAYSWPGNVRELENVVERAVVLAGGPVIEPDDLPIDISGEPPEIKVKIPPGMTGYKEVMKQVRARAGRELIIRGLRESQNNVTRAAKALGISRRSLIYMMKEFGLRRDKEPESSD